ncbi:MAG: 1-(5-phosphoribosyl)-5-[(5-phosphoribosylamino)methylideneamino] imidazole-4-carboxamide isomerase, partial [Chloroflexota bacterium]|nr:1-(5-phosphoribosyl)-5-[(5-phosphoribosylamino)methylideneamino] imidazole-4-carboxamide isomerase [Chloroflexota bacterium]
MLKRYHDTTRGASAFELLPAIDLRGGRVVRLIEGDFGRETAYADDPVGVARGFVAEGATWIHVVDLDGARGGEPAQRATISEIIRAVEGRARCQVAGGLRSEAPVAAALEIGADRVVVGTSALRDPAFAGRLVAQHGPDKIVVALDVRDGLALGEGWRAGAPGLRPTDALAALADNGVATFAVTAIDRDGRLEGPDLELLAALVALGRGRVIASGGIG